MSNAKPKAQNLITPKFRVSYPNVFKARKNDLNGKDEYGVLALFPPGTDLAKLQAAAHAACVEKWGADKAKWPKDPSTGAVDIRSPFRKQEEKRYENDAGNLVFPPGMEAGGIFMNFKSTRQPGIVDSQMQDIIQASDFYPGCFARATVNALAYGGPGTKYKAGVSFWLQNLQKMGEGEPLGSKTKAQDDFDAIEGAGESGESATSLFT